MDHGGVDAGAEALDLDEGEEAVGRRLALLDAEVLLDGFDNDVGSAAAQLAGGLSSVSNLECFCGKPRNFLVGSDGREGLAYRCACLDKELAHGVPVVHGVEGGHFVDSHGRHLQQASYLVHDTDAGEAVLALAQVEQGHDGGLLVLLGIPLEDLGDDGFILLVEFEGDIGIVVRGISVLRMSISNRRAQRSCPPLEAIIAKSLSGLDTYPLCSFESN